VEQSRAPHLKIPMVTFTQSGPNPKQDIVVILDNFRSHWATKTREKALELNIS